MTSRVAIIDNYDSYTFNIAQLVARLTGTEPEVIPVDRFDVERESEYGAIIVSPGPGHPLKEAAFDVCLQLYRMRRGPVLGVCLGHQGLIVAHGGTVARVDPAHGVLDPITHDNSGMFRGVPQETVVVRYHSLAAVDVPSHLRVTAWTAAGVVMAVEHRDLPHYGVQFHPESVLTLDGEKIVGNFLRLAGIPRAAAPTEPASLSLRGRTDSNTETRRVTRGWIDPPVVAAHVLRGRRRAFWLDSSDQREWTGRYSIMGYLSDDEPSVVVGGGEHSSGSVTAINRPDFLGHLRALEASCTPPAPDAPPATSGWVGVAGYETQELLPSTQVGSPADGFFMRVNRAIVFDHQRRTITISAATAAQADELAAAVQSTPRALSQPDAAPPLVPTTHLPTDAYEHAFDRIVDALRDGETYEAVLTFPLDLSADGDPLDQYLSLRSRSPAPFAAYLRHEDQFLLSASPELMLSVSADRHAQIRPIKGTLPRSADPEKDAVARWRLGAEDKFRRENLMIADLVRNDLGQVSSPGTVQVRQLMSVESYRGVHQLVSSIHSDLKPEMTPIDCFRAVFPAGSMTGAPKHRTMQLIREVEWAERGPYAGALGWFDGARAEFAVVIRSLHGCAKHLTLNVGGGIVVGSTPDDELREALDKARSVVSKPALHDADPQHASTFIENAHNSREVLRADRSSTEK